MLTKSYIAVALSSMAASTLAAPTGYGLGSGISETIGSITDSVTGSGNKFLGNGVGNGNNNGNDNKAGNEDGNGNVVGSGNSVSLRERDGLDTVLGSITKPITGSGNLFKGNGVGVSSLPPYPQCSNS
jgi:hypothetical protein